MSKIQDLAALLRHVRSAGIYHLPASGRGVLAKAAYSAGLAYVECELGETAELDVALQKIGHALGFPDWYGNNLDALHDCLTDLSWRDTPETVLLISGCDQLRASLPEAFDTLLSVFAAAIDYWRDDKHLFWVFIDMRADGIALLPTIA